MSARHSLPVPPAVAEFKRARAAAAAALVTVRSGERGRIPAAAVFYRAQRHAAVVSSSLLVKGYPVEAQTYAVAADLLLRRGDRAFAAHVAQMVGAA